MRAIKKAPAIYRSHSGREEEFSDLAYLLRKLKDFAEGADRGSLRTFQDSHASETANVQTLAHHFKVAGIPQKR